MKKTIMLCLLTGSLTQGSAQLRDAMMKKIGEKAKSNKTENAGTSNSATSTTTENKSGNNGTEENKGTGNSQQQNTGETANPYAAYGNSSSSSKDIKATYSFHQNVLMEMKSYDKKGSLEEKKTNKMRMYFGKEDYNGAEIIDEKNASKNMMTFEADKSQMVMLMENNGNKMAMVRKIDPSKYTKKEEGNEKKSTITKSGRTKKVCGYNCEEWVSTNEKGEKTEIWISTEVPIKMSGSYSMFGGQNKEYANYFSNADNNGGCMLDMTHYASNGEKFTMTATEVNLDAPKTINTSDYKVF